jgi:tetratricopeptide (TPR) repeat protein
MTGQAIESLRAEKRSLSFSPTISDTLQALALSPEQGFILSRVDGTSTPREILSLSPLGEEETARALIDLLECGLVKLNDEAPTEPAEAPAEAPTPDSASAPESALAPDPAIAKKRNELEELVDACGKQTPTELLGVSDQASTDEIKEAFRKKVLCFHPDRYPGITDEAFLKKLSHSVALVTDAFNTLSDNVSQEMTPTARNESSFGHAAGAGDTYNAEKHALELFHTARRAFDTQSYWEVIQLCREAIGIKDDVAKYHFLLGRALLQNKKWRKEAGESLKRAAELDSYNTEYLALLAALYQREGLQMRAKKVIEQVKSIDPDCEIPELPA